MFFRLDRLGVSGRVSGSRLWPVWEAQFFHEQPLDLVGSATKGAAADRLHTRHAILSQPMVDTLTPSRRSWLMSQVRQKHTTPELVVRRLLHSMGFRYRLHGKDLPGRPDLVFAKSKRVIFVHGCYWHRHDCKKATMPSSNVEYWTKKFAENVARDKKVLDDLNSAGWTSMIIWECQTRDAEALASSLLAFFQDQ